MVDGARIESGFRNYIHRADSPAELELQARKRNKIKKKGEGDSAAAAAAEAPKVVNGRVGVMTRVTS